MIKFIDPNPPGSYFNYLTIVALIAFITDYLSGYSTTNLDKQGWSKVLSVLLVGFIVISYVVLVIYGLYIMYNGEVNSIVDWGIAIGSIISMSGIALTIGFSYASQ